MDMGMWQEKKSVWFRGEWVTINTHWVVALVVESPADETIPPAEDYKLMVKTLEGGYWRLAEGSKEDMDSLRNSLIR
jgi:hypothetical protein